MTEGLKARQKSLADDEVFINRAIAAASRLGELVNSAEHIKKESD